MCFTLLFWMRFPKPPCSFRKPFLAAVLVWEHSSAMSALPLLYHEPESRCDSSKDAVWAHSDVGRAG